MSSIKSLSGQRWCTVVSGRLRECRLTQPARSGHQKHARSHGRTQLSRTQQDWDGFLEEIGASCIMDHVTILVTRTLRRGRGVHVGQYAVVQAMSRNISPSSASSFGISTGIHTVGTTEIYTRTRSSHSTLATLPPKPSLWPVRCMYTGAVSNVFALVQHAKRKVTHSSSFTVTIWKPLKGIWIDVLSSFCEDTSSKSSMCLSSRSTIVALTTGRVVIKVALA